MSRTQRFGPALMAQLDELATFSDDPQRLTRHYLSPARCRVMQKVRASMEAAGVTVRIDAAGGARRAAPRRDRHRPLPRHCRRQLRCRVDRGARRCGGACGRERAAPAERRRLRHDRAGGAVSGATCGISHNPAQAIGTEVAGLAVRVLLDVLRLIEVPQ